VEQLPPEHPEHPPEEAVMLPPLSLEVKAKVEMSLITSEQAHSGH